ncbi:MAG: hypothetical protein COA96_03485 [SAR86 cluster bacterium]|uniref:Methyltransferase type 11 domain-containing protein n=1 Tax=SAR86 cluster bacterium TaxID=2030880 RepID=A0A2A5B810_9GAMM|nr:MAG: hypothetical protein COA96_03485 [SAR86 cluster bacterium]
MDKHRIKISLPLLSAFILVLLTVLLTVSSATLFAQDRLVLEQALNANERDVNHLLRDDIRKPAEVMEFLGIKSGMRVLDIYAADGYYSYILSKVVGSQGVVYAQNPAANSNIEDIRQMFSLADALDERIDIASLTNIEHLRQGFFDLDIEPGSLDAVMMVQILHDFYNSEPGYASALLSHLKTLLKTGGVLAVIDHSGDKDQDNARLHRMQKNQAVELAKNAGFKLIGDSELLNNERDRRRRPVFDPMLGRNTDRFLLKFQKD